MSISGESKQLQEVVAESIHDRYAPVSSLIDYIRANEQRPSPTVISQNIFSLTYNLHTTLASSYRFTPSTMVAFNLALLVLSSSLVAAVPGWGNGKTTTTFSTSSSTPGYGYGTPTPTPSTCMATTIVSTYLTSHPYTTISDVCTTQTLPFTIQTPVTRTTITTVTSDSTGLSTSLSTGYTAYTTDITSVFNATRTSACTSNGITTDYVPSTSTTIITRISNVPVTSIIVMNVTSQGIS